MAVQKLHGTRSTTTFVTGGQECTRTLETESKQNSHALTSEQSQMWEGTQHTPTKVVSSPWTTGTHKGAESEH